MKNINNSVTIDGIDKEIIRSLMTNARTPILEIAKKNWSFRSCNSPKTEKT
jgi:Lrp/AsnC family transcriptional regulator for asnA, asnC and gidA